jgi:hypothetical protein
MSWNQSEWASSLLSSAALLALALCVADPIEPQEVLAAPPAPPAAATVLEASDANTQVAQTQDSDCAREPAAHGDEMLER